MTGMARVSSVDGARGLAIVMMVIYHVIFDLSYFGIYNIDLSNIMIVIFQRIIGTAFILLVGISIVLSEQKNKEGYFHHAKRAALLGIVALGITVATWIYPHEGFIKFGIIHLIAVSTLIAPFFNRFGRINIAFGALLIIAGLVIGQMQTAVPYLFWLGLTAPDYTALDHYPILPWFGVVLIGLYLGQKFVIANHENKEPKTKQTTNPLENALAYLGRNSLVIYLIHQPIIIALLMLIWKIF